MPLFRTLTTKLKIAISPQASPSTSLTSPQTSPSSFEVISGRKESSFAVKRPETSNRYDSFSGSETSNASNESVDQTVHKQRRVSKFREELDFGDE